MSIKLTQNNIPMVESQSLQLVLASAQVHEKIALYLSNTLKNKGYKLASPSVLNFLSTLECGINFGSEIARTLGVSRQMVAKTVKELCQAGYLVQREGKGKQKEICFTLVGEQLMSEARQLLAEIDLQLTATVGQATLEKTVTELQHIQQLITQLTTHGE